jgi:hypothetical protein
MTLDFKLGPIRGHVYTCFTFWPITFELFQPINAFSSYFPIVLPFHITWGNVWKNSTSTILFDLTYYHLSHESWFFEPWKWSYLSQHLDLQCNNYKILNNFVKEHSIKSKLNFVRKLGYIINEFTIGPTTQATLMTLNGKLSNLVILFKVHHNMFYKPFMQFVLYFHDVVQYCI